MASTTRTIIIPAQVNPVAVCGPEDSIIRLVEKAYPDLNISVRGNRISIVSLYVRTEPLALEAEGFIQELIDEAFTAPLEADEVERLLHHRLSRKLDRKERKITTWNPRFDQFGLTDNLETQKKRSDLRPAFHGQPHDERSLGHSVSGSSQTLSGRIPSVITMAHGVPVRAKTAGQMVYINAIESHTITFAIGPAGTGKTYLAVAKAVRAFEDGAVRRIILTRPAVEAGESLGFLPGTLNEKVDPYLRPLYDALADMLGNERMQRYLADNTIEVAPLAYMRGRTLNDAYVILDEAQNTTQHQMKMFLTRLGFNTRMIITGDATQVDFAVRNSGLKNIEKILGHVDDVAFIHLGSQDIVRHSLVGKIVDAYQEFQGEELARQEKDGQDER
ncbi:MAG: PhoH family protein [Parascardovia denticolens]